MISVRTPLRVSFFGGGTDFREFYYDNGGCVLSSAIDKFVGVAVTRRDGNLIIVDYDGSSVERVTSVDSLQHDIVRECLRHCGVEPGLEVRIASDVSSTGTGLGSSSSLTVGLVNAFWRLRDQAKDATALARLAADIEIGVLGRPIGLQDQVIAAHGGLRVIHFGPGDRITVDSPAVDQDVLARLDAALMLFDTGLSRRSESVLADVKCSIPDNRATLLRLADAAHQAIALLGTGDLVGFADLLHEGWELKKTLAGNISNEYIDEIYQAARDAGALGGKIAGAGNGGSLLLFCPPERQPEVRRRLSNLAELPFNLWPGGSELVAADD